MRAVRLVAPKEHLGRLISEAVKTAQTLICGDRALLWVVDRDRGDMWASIGKHPAAPVRLKIDESTLVGSVAVEALDKEKNTGSQDSSKDRLLSLEGLRNVKNC